MATEATTTKLGGEGEEDINIATLSEDKIKQLMQSDPKFISRLISVRAEGGFLVQGMEPQGHGLPCHDGGATMEAHALGNLAPDLHQHRHLRRRPLAVY